MAPLHRLFHLIHEHLIIFILITAPNILIHVVIISIYQVELVLEAISEI